ncbi:hypothetical protein RQP54_17700 [Curvibacter sp. APW13]|uniref:hypothetical protein n=1 Tax=Curvibacter sp. APW13 TaxID=3077236 RepID=UPI0028DF48D2|nr:hypothetical protein [Curvibacter sp. APW13]MDT8992711.1 hypothetical protein [Curvibacter sp. APW13]
MPKKPKQPPVHEVRFLEKVRDLVASSDRAREEAESYAEMISDPGLKAQAEKLLDR